MQEVFCPDAIASNFKICPCPLFDWFRARLDLPAGKLAAVAAFQTFGDYLAYHPHLHVLATTGLFDREHRFHLIPVETVEPLAELFRHRFLETLLREKLISEKKLRRLLAWKHSGFNLDAGDKPVAANNFKGRRCLAEPSEIDSLQGERSESISPPRPVLAQENHMK